MWKLATGRAKSSNDSFKKITEEGKFRNIISNYSENLQEFLSIIKNLSSDNCDNLFDILQKNTQYSFLINTDRGVLTNRSRWNKNSAVEMIQEIQIKFELLDGLNSTYLDKQKFINAQNELIKANNLLCKCIKKEECQVISISENTLEEPSQITEREEEYENVNEDLDLDEALKNINIPEEETWHERQTIGKIIQSEEENKDEDLEYILNRINEQYGIEEIRSVQFLELFPGYRSSSVWRRSYGNPLKGVGCFKKDKTNRLLDDINKKYIMLTSENMRASGLLTQKNLRALANKLKAWNRGCGITVPQELSGGKMHKRTKKRGTNKKTKKRHSNKKKRKTHRR
jgi:hypothetical protein